MSRSYCIKSDILHLFILFVQQRCKSTMNTVLLFQIHFRRSLLISSDADIVLLKGKITYKMKHSFIKQHLSKSAGC
jgi:hypothetical protein